MDADRDKFGDVLGNWLAFLLGIKRLKDSGLPPVDEDVQLELARPVAK